jgi:hypothetical protein
MREKFLCGVSYVYSLVRSFFLSLSHERISLSLTFYLYSLTLFPPHTPSRNISSSSSNTMDRHRFDSGMRKFCEWEKYKSSNNNREKRGNFFPLSHSLPPLKTVWWLCIAVNRITQHSFSLLFFFRGGFLWYSRV